MTLKNKIINHIIDIEGGYINDMVYDSGGETNFGITKATAIAYGYMGDMQKLERKTAYEIYTILFWDKLYLDDISALSGVIAEEIADTAINMGKTTSAIFLQRCLNVLNYRQRFYRDIRVDGVIGRKTIFALKKYLEKRGKEGEDILLGMLNSLQGAKYIKLAERREKDEIFIFGWFKNRIVEPIKKAIKEFRDGSKSSSYNRYKWT